MISHASKRKLSQRSVAYSVRDAYVTSGDVYWPFVSLYLNGKTASADVSAKAITVSGNAALSTAQSKYQPNWYFDGTGDVLNVEGGVSHVFDTGDFTIECWAYFTGSMAGSQTIYDARPASTNGAYVLFTVSAGKLQLVYSGLVKITGSATLSANTWYHLALVRKSGVFYTYINGAQDGTHTDASINFSSNPTGRPYIGGDSYSAASYVQGYIEGLRVTKGVARYIGGFTVPGAAFDAFYTLPYFVTNGDPYWTAVSFASHGDSITADLTGKSITAYGNAAVSSTQSKYGGSAWYFDGTGDYISSATNTAFQFGTGDLTMEAWVMPSLFVGSSRAILETRDGSYANGITLFCTSGGVVSIAEGGSVALTTSATLSTSSIWYHVAYSRISGTARVFVDGVQVGSYSSSYNSSNNTLRVGANGGNSDNWAGYIDDIRITKGVARYTGNFTPPVQAFDHYQAPVTPVDGDPYYGNVVFHSHFESLADQKGATLTAYGNAVVSTNQLKFGSKSLALDGTGDYVGATLPTGGFGPSDLTIECWVYPTTVSVMQDVFANRGGAGSATAFNFSITPSGALTYYSTGTVVTTANSLVVATQWQHIAFCRYNGVVRIFLNGVLVASVADTSDYSTTSLAVGSYVGGGEYFNGYIDELRITKGVARYTYNFTPPNAAFYDYKPAVITEASDPWWSNVVFLSHFETLTDQKGKTITAVGNAAVALTQPKFGSKSLALDGTGDYVTLDGSSDFAFGTGDFTVEMWVYLTAGTGNERVLYDSRPTSVDGLHTVLQVTTGNVLLLWANSATRITGTTTVSLNTWHHVVLCRGIGVTRIFLNGVQEGAAYTDTNSYTVGASRPIVGAHGFNTGTSAVTGYIDEVRITKGVARYTGNFTIPAAAFYSEPLPQPNKSGYDDYWSNVVFLSHFDALKDEKLHVLTPAGNAAISSSASKFGGKSLYLDGTGDYVATESTADLAFGTGDYTIEFWMRIDSDCTGSRIWEMSGDNLDFNVTNKTLTYHSSYSTPNNSFQLGVWHHVALSRQNGTMRIFIDGLLSVSSADSVNSTARIMYIGGVSNMLFKGYIDELRITKGIARYTAPFQVPAEPFYSPLPVSANTPAGGDPYYGNVVFHSHFESLADQKGATLTAYGNAAVALTQPKFGSKSLALDGTGDYIGATMVDGTGAGDFTVEAWIYPTSLPGIMDIYATRGGAGSSTGFNWSVNASGGLTSYDNSTILTSGNGLIVANNWHHVAMTRRNGYISYWVNGVLVATTTGVNTNTGTTTTLTVGSYNGGGGEYFNGYIDELRITKGIARYTSNFNPQTAAYLDYSPATVNDPYYDLGVKLLMHFDGVDNGTTFIDSKGHTVTAAGNACTKIAQSKFGVSSLYLDGTGDYLTLDGSSDFAFGTGDFTIEGWIRRAATGSRHDILDFRPTSTQGWYPLWYVSAGNVLILEGSTGATLITGSTTISADTWYHVVIAKSGSTTKMFLNGTQEGSSYSDSNTYVCGASRPAVGSSGYSLGSECFQGYIDDLRITKGYARYTGAFTPPTSSFPG